MSGFRTRTARRPKTPEGTEAPHSTDEAARLREEIARLNRLVEEHAQERVSLQALVDSVPDYLWVKDVDSAFVVANKAVSDDNRTSDRTSLIGLTDFALHPRERAQKFFDAEQSVVRTGQAVV